MFYGSSLCCYSLDNVSLTASCLWPLNLVWFFPRKIRYIKGEILYLQAFPVKIPVKNTGFFPRQTAPKRSLAYSYARFYVGTRTSPPPPPLPRLPAWPGPPSLPCPPGQLLPAPAKPCPAPATECFLQFHFFKFPGRYQIFLSCEKTGKNSVQEEKSHLLRWSNLARRAAQHRTLFSGILLSCSLLHVHNAAEFTATVSTWHSCCEFWLSKLSLTVTLSCVIVGFFHITSSRCCGIKSTKHKRKKSAQIIVSGNAQCSLPRAQCRGCVSITGNGVVNTEGCSTL